MSRRLILIALLAILASALTLPAVAGAIERAGWSLDAEFAAIAERYPGFGGLYYDQEGRPHVYLKDMNLASIFYSLGDDVQIHRGDYDFRELLDWRLSARAPVFEVPGAVTLDVDERSNRVRIGVDRASAKKTIARIRASLDAAGIPREAVIFEARDPIFFAQTLRDQIRPVPGGVQIRFSNFLCTLGWNASRGGVSGFVTNSHCTDKQGGVSRRNPTLYYQPLNQVAGEFIGTERVDPKYFKRKNGCPRGSSCRFSDSAWAEYDAPSLSDDGKIAQTASCGQFSGSLDIVGEHNINGFATGNSPVGTIVTKVGRTTGCTTGPVDESAVDVGVSGSNIVLLSQDIVIAGVGGGDSGSPVFSESGSVTLRGILWGGNGAGTLFVYSPYSAVQSELGLD